MLIRNIYDHHLYAALDAANALFAGNITFKRKEYAGTTRHHTNKYRVTLTVKDSRKPGSRRSPSHWHRISAACWHAHRAFLDALPPQAEVITVATVTGSDGQRNRDGTIWGHLTHTVPWHPGDPHLDWNIGSQTYPCQASEACDCADADAEMTVCECHTVCVWSGVGQRPEHCMDAEDPDE